ncbi:helix-turn-helix domain-containing protein [Xanthobacter autotrophicus]|uniref:helix-turn-helix domain-containing protein n=1 Tax=Xanthobacter autotrophicus TaxID=280 RepID=UPI003728A90F
MTFVADTAKITSQRADTFEMQQEPQSPSLQVAGFRAEDALAYDINTIALMLGVCRATVFNEIKRGNLEARKLGRKTIVTRGAAKAYLANLPARSAA